MCPTQFTGSPKNDSLLQIEELTERGRCFYLNISSLQSNRRYNNFKVDPLSYCNCTPNYTAENAVSAR
ncbi:hypothetical protein EG68_09250, partial [Paragonimus skrjabini miyazakii]